MSFYEFIYFGLTIAFIRSKKVYIIAYIVAELD